MVDEVDKVILKGFVTLSYLPIFNLFSMLVFSMRVILKLGSNFNQRNFDRIDWKIATSYGVDIDPSTISLLYCGVMK